MNAGLSTSLLPDGLHILDKPRCPSVAHPEEDSSNECANLLNVRQKLGAIGAAARRTSITHITKKESILGDKDQLKRGPDWHGVETQANLTTFLHAYLATFTLHAHPVVIQYHVPYLGYLKTARMSCVRLLVRECRQVVEIAMRNHHFVHTCSKKPSTLGLLLCYAVRCPCRTNKAPLAVVSSSSYTCALRVSGVMPEWVAQLLVDADVRTGLEVVGSTDLGSRGPWRGKVGAGDVGDRKEGVR